MDWNTIGKGKSFGGLGIINLNSNNQALILKWPWRFRHESHALWKDTICEKYNFSDSDLWPAPYSPHSLSRVWSDIQHNWHRGQNSNFIKNSLFLCADDGSRIRFWSDKWINNTLLE